MRQSIERGTRPRSRRDLQLHLQAMTPEIRCRFQALIEAGIDGFRERVNELTGRQPSPEEQEVVNEIASLILGQQKLSRDR